jgi:hypothetical protein
VRIAWRGKTTGNAHASAAWIAASDDVAPPFAAPALAPAASRENAIAAMAIDTPD